MSSALPAFYMTSKIKDFAREPAVGDGRFTDSQAKHLSSGLLGERIRRLFRTAENVKSCCVPVFRVLPFNPISTSIKKGGIGVR